MFKKMLKRISGLSALVSILSVSLAQSAMAAIDLSGFQTAVTGALGDSTALILILLGFVASMFGLYAVYNLARGRKAV